MLTLLRWVARYTAPPLAQFTGDETITTDGRPSKVMEEMFAQMGVKEEHSIAEQLRECTLLTIDVEGMAEC